MTTSSCSDDHHALLAANRGSRHAALASVRGHELFIEGVCVRVVDVVVDTCLVVEAGGLPELLHVGVRVIVVEGELGEVADQEQAEEVGFETCEE